MADQDNSLTNLNQMMSNLSNYYSSQKQQPQAIQIPTTPSVSQAPDDSEDDNEVQSTNSPVSTLLKAGQKYNNLKQTPTPNEQPFGDTLSKLLNPNSQELEDAKKNRNDLQLLALINKAGETFGNALTPLARHEDNSDFTNGIMQLGNQQVNDVKAKAQQALENVKTQDLAAKLQTEAAKNKADSPEARLLQSVISQAAQKAGLDLNSDALENANLSTLENIKNTIEGAANTKLKYDTLAQNAKDSREAKRAFAEAQSEQKDNAKQSQAVNQTTQLLESARGNPEVQQALKDRYAASKANALISQNFDPNNMSPQQINLLVSEIGKIASGGVPSVEEMKVLSPSTLSSQFASISSKLLNKPTPANAGEFIKQYKSYLDDLNSNAQNVIKDKFGRVLETHKKQLGDDNYQTLKDQYLTPFETKAESKQVASSHPQDQEAIAWAQSNPNDPRAAAILKANGM